MLFEIDQHKSLLLLEATEEEEEGSLFSIDIFRDHHHNHHGHDHDGKEDDDQSEKIYVGVGQSSKSESSMDALMWTLNRVISSKTVLYLIHVFPVIRLIPSPCMLPRSKVNPRLVENYVAQERDKRRKLLQRYIEACLAAKVKVDTVLIESDMVAKALIDLIPTLNIRKLVVGTNQSSLRKLKYKGRSGIAKQIVQNAPETCDIKIVCDGKEGIEHLTGRSSSSLDSNASSLATQEEYQDQQNPSTEIMTRSPFHASPLSGQVWNLFKRVRIKPILTFGGTKTQPNNPISL